MKTMKRVSSSNALKRVSSGNGLKEMAEVATTSMRRVSSKNGLKEMAEVATSSMKRVSSRNGLKEMAEMGKSLRKITNTNVKGIMKRVGSKKVVKRREAEDSDVTSMGSQRSPVSVSEVDGAEGVEWENVTLYDVEVDDEALAAKGFDPPVTMEIAPASESTIPAENLVQVVLLLTDATTRRFEIVKLDLDSTKARVVDILKQIPNVATDESLQVKKYVAICSRKGAQMGKYKLVTEYFRQEGNNTASNFALAVPEGMNAKDSARVASPILSDNKILSMLDIESSTLNKLEPELDTPTLAPLSPSSTDDEGSTDTEEVVDTESDTIEKTETETKQLKSNVKSSLISTFAILFIAAFSVSAKHYNDYISSPLGPGDILYPGEKRHTCGLLRFLPEEHTGCHSLTLENDGTGSLGLYDGEELLWEMHVPTCNEGCAVTLNENGKVLIGDNEGFFSSKGPSNVSPWPFSQIVKNSYKKKSH